MQFGVNNPGGPWNIVLDMGPDPSIEKGSGPLLNFGTLLLSPKRLKRET